MTNSVRMGWGGWLAGWLALLSLMAIGLANARERVLAQLDRPEVRTQWQDWKAEAQRQSQLGAGPVQRRAPKSDEPPALILFRDHFSAVVASAAVLGSALYWFLAIALRGAWRMHSGAPSAPANNVSQPIAADGGVAKKVDDR